MKKIKFLAISLVAVLFSFSACDNIPEPDYWASQILVTLYAENFGDAATASPWPTINEYVGFKTTGKGAAKVKYTSEGGMVSVRGNSPSNYPGASGNCNVMMAATTGASLIVNDIATCGAKKLYLSFGSNQANDTLSVSYKVDNAEDWTPIEYTKTTSTWGRVENLEINIETGNTIKLKFTAPKTGFGVRVDDIKIITTDAVGDPVIDGNGGDEEKVGEGDGTKVSPYNVKAAMSNQSNQKAWVKGYIVGSVKSGDKGTIESNDDVVFGLENIRNTVILLADSKDSKNYAECIAVNLPTGNIRAAVNLVDNAGNLGEEIMIYGVLRTYFGVPGLRDLEGYLLHGAGIDPDGGSIGDGILSETLLTQASFNKFTTYSVSGSQVWTFSDTYGAVMSGFADNKSNANEDWLISPAMNLSTVTSAVLSFEHARGPAGSINVGLAEGYYTVWISNDYNSGNPTTSTWTQVEGINHGTAAWGYVSSGNLTIPQANLKTNARIAFKYLCTDAASATWEIKNILVK